MQHKDTGKGFMQRGPTYLSHDPISPGKSRLAGNQSAQLVEGKTKGQFIPEQTDKSKSGPGSYCNRGDITDKQEVLLPGR